MRVLQNHVGRKGRVRPINMQRTTQFPRLNEMSRKSIIMASTVASALYYAVIPHYFFSRTVRITFGCLAVLFLELVHYVITEDIFIGFRFFDNVEFDYLNGLEF